MKKYAEHVWHKGWVLCESRSGIVCNMELYRASGDNLVYAVVSKILEPLQEKKQTLLVSDPIPTLFYVQPQASAESRRKKKGRNCYGGKWWRKQSGC